MVDKKTSTTIIGVRHRCDVFKDVVGMFGNPIMHQNF
jgi:hypothetical protein